MSQQKSKKPSPNNEDRARYSFTLRLSATELTEQIVNTIYGLGLDDVLVGESRGSVYVDFDVEGASFADAILNAIESVENALDGVKVTGVHPPGEDAIEDANSFLRTRNNPKLWERLKH